jgi:hypothetical protein
LAIGLRKNPMLVNSSKNCVGKTPRFSAIDVKGIRFILFE